MGGPVHAAQIVERAGLVVSGEHPLVVRDFVAGLGPELVDFGHHEGGVGVHEEAEVVGAEFAAEGFDFDGLRRGAGLLCGFLFLEGLEFAFHVGVGFFDEVRLPVVERHVWAGGQPLDPVDPSRACGEPRSPHDAAAPNHAAGVVRIGFGKHVVVRVEPVFDIRTRLERVAHHSCGGEVGVAECFAEENHADPAIHGLAGGFLVVAIGKTIAVGEAVSAPEVERAEAWEAFLSGVVVRVVLRDESRHFPVAGGKVWLKLRKQSRRIDEVALVEMRVGEVLRTVGRREADESFVPWIEGEELPLFARRVGEPVFHPGPQFIQDGIERWVFGLCCDERRLRIPLHLFATPVSIAAECLLRVGVMLREQLLHARRVE